MYNFMKYIINLTTCSFCNGLQNKDITCLQTKTHIHRSCKTNVKPQIKYIKQTYMDVQSYPLVCRLRLLFLFRL